MNLNNIYDKSGYHCLMLNSIYIFIVHVGDQERHNSKYGGSRNLCLQFENQQFLDSVIPERL